jgi:glycosyltransferase involved in cell wall biosynthesis
LISRAIPRLALISVGLGTVRRGFERYFQELLTVLQDRMDITLYRSAGDCGPREKIPPLLRAISNCAKALPLGSHAGGPDYKRKCLAFAVSLAPELIRGNFDVVHCIDPPFATALLHLRRLLPIHSRILFTEGCAIPPEFYPRADHIHHVAKYPFDVAIAANIPKSHMTLLPCGMHPDRFIVQTPRAELRAKYDVGEDTFVILAVSALQRTFKRVDYIIDEISRIDGNVLLWIDGNPEEPDLAEVARAKLGARCRITHVPSRNLPELYRLADVMVHASVTEAFGLAILEACCSGLPVITHNASHFQWLIGDTSLMADMTIPGKMANLVRTVMATPRAESAARITEIAQTIRRRFDWESLASQYVDMYTRVAEMRRGPN